MAGDEAAARRYIDGEIARLRADILARKLLWQHAQTHRTGGGDVITLAASPPSGAAGGDLTGTYPNPTVKTVHAGSQHQPLMLAGATAATRYVGGTASGAPISGTFAIGDFVIDQTGKVFVCTVAGTPGTWVQAGGGAGAPNALLDGVTHTDTLAGAVARGDVIVGNATPKWARLARPLYRQVLTSDATDALWDYTVTKGLYAARPAAATAMVGALYMATDRANTLYRCTENPALAWDIVNPRQETLRWYFDGSVRVDLSNPQGAIHRLPADMGPWRPVEAIAQIPTGNAPAEGGTPGGTATSGTTTTLTKTAAGWTVDQWIGAVCSITAGTNSGKKGRIASNTATVLTFVDAFSVAIDNTSVYSIASGVRVGIFYGSTGTPATALFTRPASDTTADTRLTVAVTALEGVASAFVPTSIPAGSRVLRLIEGVGGLVGSEGADVNVSMRFEQADG